MTSKDNCLSFPVPSANPYSFPNPRRINLTTWLFHKQQQQQQQQQKQQQQQLQVLRSPTEPQPQQ